MFSLFIWQLNVPVKWIRLTESKSVFLYCRVPNEVLNKQCLRPETRWEHVCVWSGSFCFSLFCCHHYPYIILLHITFFILLADFVCDHIYLCFVLSYFEVSKNQYFLIQNFMYNADQPSSSQGYCYTWPNIIIIRHMEDKLWWILCCIYTDWVPNRAWSSQFKVQKQITATHKQSEEKEE